MLQKQIFHTKLYLSTTRKLTNKNKNIDKMFPSEYTTGIIVGKEEIKTNPKSTMKLIKTKKKRVQWRVIYTDRIIDGINVVGKIHP